MAETGAGNGSSYRSYVLPQLRFPKENQSGYKGVIEFRLVHIDTPTIDISAASDLINYLTDDNQGTGSIGPAGGPTPIPTNTTAILPGRVETPSAYPNVTLYLPQAVVFGDGIEYENVNLGLIGATAEKAINSGNSLGEAIVKAVNAGTSSYTDLFTRLPSKDLASLAITKVAGDLPVIGDVASATLRTAVNPNRRVLFRSVQGRDFVFSFKLIANSAGEAQEIQDIIAFFRREMYPTSIDVEGVSVGYKHPFPFRIDLKYGSAQVGTKILNSYLRNISTTYNQSSMGYHSDGKPSEVDIQLTFVEERSLTRNDVEAGY